MRWLLLMLIALQAATCGQKGPLVLPEPSSPAAASALPELRSGGS
jgi:predicted small lipoprotein YifL